MLIAAASLCGALAVVAAGIGFTGVLKSLAGVAKAAFFGLLALAGALTAAYLVTTKKLGS